MALFRKRSNDPGQDEPGEDQAAPDPAASGRQTETPGQGAEGAADPDRPGGPYDVTDAPKGQKLIDFGAILLPVEPGDKVSAEVSKATGQPQSVAISKGGSKIQLQAFAAPKTRGIWDEVRGEISASVAKQGGVSREVTGRFGAGLLIEVPGTNAQGRKGKHVFRVIGVDGPRWMLRGTITGKGARDESAAGALQDAFARIVVNRGQVAMPPREPLPLKLPGAGEAEAEQVPEDPMALLRRGPEITEVR